MKKYHLIHPEVLLFLIFVGLNIFSNNAVARLLSCYDGFEPGDHDHDGRISFQEAEESQKQAEKNAFNMLQAEFEKDDTNSDNLISLDEYEADFQYYVSYDFEKADTDKDGMVNCEQIQAVHTLLKNNDCDYLKIFDKDNDQNLSYAEYSMAYKEGINEDFNNYDENNNAYIDRNEYDALYWSPTSEHKDEYIRKDINNDQYLTIAEYCGERYISKCKRMYEVCEGTSDSDKERCKYLKLKRGEPLACQWVIKDHPYE